MRNQALVAAILFGLAGSLATLLVYGFGDRPVLEVLPEALMAGAAASLVGGLLWAKVALQGTASASVRRGALVGGLIGFVAHPVFWYIGAVYAWAFYEPGAAGEYLGPIHGLWGALLLSLVSWLLAGWVTVPVGALTGGLLAALWRKG